MRLRRLRQPPRIGMNMTPMIDIVFLLIIFFMTVSQITQTLGEPINLPNVGPDGRPLESVSITINLDSDGRKIIASQSYAIDELMAAVRKELARIGNRHDLLKVLVRCDRDCPGRFLNELTQELAKAGIPRIRVSVQGHDRE